MPESYQQVVSQAFRRGIKRRAKEIITGKDLYDKVKGETEEERTEREKANTLPPNFNIADFDDEEDPFKYVERTRTKDHVQMMDYVKTVAAERQKNRKPIKFRASVWEFD